MVRSVRCGRSYSNFLSPQSTRLDSIPKWNHSYSWSIDQDQSWSILFGIESFEVVTEWYCHPHKSRPEVISTLPDLITTLGMVIHHMITQVMIIPVMEEVMWTIKSVVLLSLTIWLLYHSLDSSYWPHIFFGKPSYWILWEEESGETFQAIISTMVKFSF